MAPKIVEQVREALGLTQDDLGLTQDNLWLQMEVKRLQQENLALKAQLAQRNVVTVGGTTTTGVSIGGGGGGGGSGGTSRFPSVGGTRVYRSSTGNWTTSADWTTGLTEFRRTNEWD